MPFRTTTWACVIAVGCLLGQPAGAEESKLGKAFDSALEGIAERCEKAEAGKLLAVIRLDDAVRDAPLGVEDALFDAIETGLKAAAKDLEVQRCPLAETTAIDATAKRLLSIREVRKLGEEFEFDVVLAATFRVTRGSAAIRLALFDGDRRLSLDHVTVGEKTMTAAIDRYRNSSPRPSTRPPGGTLQPGGTLRPGTGRPSTRPGGRPIAGLPPGRNRPGGDIPRPDPDGDTPPPDPGEDSGPKPPGGGEAVGLNKGVLDFAQRNFGKQVGNGECWTLANDALIAAGARRANGYTFGRGIPRTDVTPGDILQFKSVRLERGNRYWNLGTPHHTAVVEAAEGNVVTILHQNFGTRTVTRFTIDFGDMVKGEVHAFRPVK